MKYESICMILAGKKKAPRVPSVSKLLKDYETGVIDILFRTTEDIKTGLTIFDNGYVVYGNGQRTKVYAMITYWYKKKVLDLATGTPLEDHVIDPKNEELDDYDIPRWQYDMTSFGEYRLMKSEGSRVGQKEFQTEEVGLEAGNYEERFMDEDVCDRLFVADLMQCMNKNQEMVIRLYFWNRLTFEQIAGVMNALYIKEGKKKRATRQSVSQMADRALKKMRKKIKESEKLQ